MILTAANYGGARHPSWYHNLLAHPECELHIGRRGGSFVAREIEGAERAAPDGIRTIRMLRLTPGGPGTRDRL